ncbi:DUF6415 family natural product biosynthesis protein [Streptomyces scopuliridis]|uniref:DUF6415 family natural product biosynthesis protein n=1 Tax=Streptomyces scopuliridis TaxID=452529 RepID=UPI0036818289
MTVVAEVPPRRAAPDRAASAVAAHRQDRVALTFAGTQTWDWYELPFALGAGFEDLEVVLGERAAPGPWDLGPLAHRLTGLLSRLGDIAVRQGYVAAAPVTRSRRLCTSTEELPDCFIQARARVRLLALATSDLLDLLLEDSS